MRALVAVLCVVSLEASAAELSDHPQWESCTRIFRMQPYVPVRVDVPVTLPLPSGTSATGPSAGSSSGSPGFSGMGSMGGGGKDAAYALLVIAVVVIALLPFIVYAADDAADALTASRFECPEFTFSMLGGAQLTSDPLNPVAGIASARVRTLYSWFGVDAQADVASSRLPAGQFSAHLLVRPPPKQHIEGAFALGYRLENGPGGQLTGLDFGLPHQYVFYRDGYKSYGLELAPRFFINSRAFDAGVEAAAVVSLVDFIQVRLGANVFSHATAVQFAVSAGLSAWF
jgi:hypothetical protein